MPPVAQNRPDMAVFDTITAIDRMMRQSINRRLPPGTPFAHFEILRLFAHEGDGHTPAELARALMMTKGAITSILQKMEAAGHVKVVDDKADRRKKRVRLTKAGMDLYAGIVRKLKGNTQALRASFTDAEFREALPFLKAVRVFMEDVLTWPAEPSEEPR
jgi:DNA-binding MarR family transcriptional regulator